MDYLGRCLARQWRPQVLERELRLIGDDPEDGIAVFGMMPVQDAAREDESVARIPI